jgi:hypothetical protein
MKPFKILLRATMFITRLLVNTTIGLWNLLVSLINVVDGGDEDDTHDKPRHVTRHNHHTGETDRVRYPDGIYPDDRIDRGISDP